MIGDGGFAAVPLVQSCQQLKNPVKLVSRLRLDARLHDFPDAQPPGKHRRKPKKGARLPNLAQQLADPTTDWRTLTVPWYGGVEKDVETATGACLWYRRGRDPVAIRWVLIRCPNDSFRPQALFCSDIQVPVGQILLWFVTRWSIEVTFAEFRPHLGFETQRQWSDKAIEGTTPCLFGLFSLVVLMDKVLYPTSLPTRQTC